MFAGRANQKQLISAQLSFQKFRGDGPCEPGEPWIVAVPITQSEAVTRVLEKMPIERLAISVEARFQAILHGNAGHMIVAAKEDQGRASEIFDRIVRMART